MHISRIAMAPFFESKGPVDLLQEPAPTLVDARATLRHQRQVFHLPPQNDRDVAEMMNARRSFANRSTIFLHTQHWVSQETCNSQ